MIKVTYNQLRELVDDRTTYPIQSACRHLLEQGITGRLEIHPNDRYEDGDGIPDVVYPSISNAAKNANASYYQKNHHYAAWYPIVQKNRKSIAEVIRT